MIRQERICNDTFYLQHVLREQAIKRRGVVEQVTEHIRYWHDEKRPSMFNTNFFRAVY